MNTQIPKKSVYIERTRKYRKKGQARAESTLKLTETKKRRNRSEARK
jgi:hypothetical protein